MAVGSDSRWVKIGQIASELGVGDHVIRHYTEKLKEVLGDNIQVDTTSKHTLYNEEAVRLLTLTRKMVSEDKMTVSQVEVELKRAKRSNVPMASKLQMDTMRSYGEVLNRLDGLEQRYERLESAFQAVGEKLRVLDNLEHLPLAISTLQDDLRNVDTKALLEQLQEEKAVVEAIRETNEELLKRLEEAEKREIELKSALQTQGQEMTKGMDEAVNRMLEEGERRWVSAKLPEKREKGLAAAIRVLFGKG